MNGLERLKQAEENEPMGVLVMPLRKHCNGCPAAHCELWNIGWLTKCYATEDKRAVGKIDQDETPEWCPVRKAIGIIEPGCHIAYLTEEE